MAMEPNQLDELYGDAILAHRRHPRNHKKLETPDITGHAVNPFCGDEVDLQIVLDDDRVSKVGAQGVGCSINQAVVSMLSEAIDRKSLEEVEALSGLFQAMMGGSPPSEEDLERLGDLKTLSAVRQYPVRIKCALLAWTALEEAIEDYEKERRT